MSNQLNCEKRVVTEQEHQYWMDRTIPFPGVNKKYQQRYRVCNMFYDETVGLVNTDHIGEDLFIIYHPLSRILSWGGWSHKAHASYTNPNIHILGHWAKKSKSKSKLAKELLYFKGDSNIILDHFDENSFWYWDSYEAPYSERTKFDTIYDPITKKSTYSKMIQEETA